MTEMGAQPHARLLVVEMESLIANQRNVTMEIPLMMMHAEQIVQARGVATASFRLVLNPVMMGMIIHETLVR